MKISELIKELEYAQKYCGDIPVVITQDTWDSYFDLEPNQFKAVIHNDKACLSITGEY